MEPKEKAIELVDKYLNYVNCWGDNGEADYKMANRYAKQCALIAVDEILDALDKSLIDADIEWFKQVKQEIEKL